nr:hypothetical protein [Pseudomonadota bacterium]
QLGGEVATLLDVGTPLGSSFSGIAPQVREIGVLRNLMGGSLSDRELAVRGWAIVQADRVMPYDGAVDIRAWTSTEVEAIQAAAVAVGVDADQGLERLGRACDVYLNDGAIWSGIPERVWGYKIGGYTVLRKWLSYRDVRVLNRPLRSREASHVSDVAKRLTLLSLLTPHLDQHYAAVRDAAFAWRTAPARPTTVI